LSEIAGIDDFNIYFPRIPICLNESGHPRNAEYNPAEVGTADQTIGLINVYSEHTA